MLIVQKSKLAENGEYNLSGERYREGVAVQNVFPLVGIDFLPGLRFEKTDGLR